MIIYFITDDKGWIDKLTIQIRSLYYREILRTEEETLGVCLLLYFLVSVYLIWVSVQKNKNDNSSEIVDWKKSTKNKYEWDGGTRGQVNSIN